MDSFLSARAGLRAIEVTLHRRLLRLVRQDPVCRRLMRVRGVGPVVSLAFVATIDDPSRFSNSKAVGPALGLAPRLNQSGETERIGRISRCGDAMMRGLLFEPATVLLTRVQTWSWLKAWAVNLARRLAVILHRIWVDGSEFQWTRSAA